MRTGIKKLMTCSLLLVISLVTVFSSNTSAVLYTTANFNQNGLTGPAACGSLSCYWWSNGSNNFRIPMQGAAAYRTGWISTSKYYGSSGKSLGVQLQTPPNPGNPNPSDWEKQRVEFEVSNGTYYTQHLDDSRYYSFAMYIHNDPPALLKGAIFSQVWQSTDPGKHPPLALRFQDNTNYRWRVVGSRDSSSNPDGQEFTIYNSDYELQRGMWHQFIVRFRPSVTGQGAVQVWHNNDLRANMSQSSGQNIGYAQDNSPVVNNSFATRVGAYRKPEPNNTTEIILFFDQAKFGTTKPDVDF